MIVSSWSILNAIIMGTFIIILFHFRLVRMRVPNQDAIKPYFIMILLIVLRVVLPIDSEAFFVIRSTRILTRLYEFSESWSGEERQFQDCCV